MPSQVVESVHEAEFLLAHGTECLGRAGDVDPREATLDEIREVLEAGAQRGLPLLIANPDIVTVSGSGLITMPGTFGRWYKEMGGQVSTLSQTQLIAHLGHKNRLRPGAPGWLRYSRCLPDALQRRFSSYTSV